MRDEARQWGSYDPCCPAKIRTGAPFILKGGLNSLWCICSRAKGPYTLSNLFDYEIFKVRAAPVGPDAVSNLIDRAIIVDSVNLSSDYDRLRMVGLKIALNIAIFWNMSFNEV